MKAAYGNVMTKKRELKGAIKHYRNMKKGMDYLKTPVVSDDEV